MITEFWIPLFLAAFLIGLFLRDEFLGLLGLMGGLLLFDRNFARLNVTVGGIPFFITELCLMAWIVKRLIQHPQSLWVTVRAFPKGLQIAWGLFLLAGAISFLRGLHTYSALNVLRDSALCYYSVVMILTATLPWTLEKLQKGAKVLTALAVIKAVAILLFLPMPPFQWLGFFQGQPAATSMLCSFVFLSLLATTRLEFSLWQHVQGIATLSTIIFESVRSAWTGLVVGLLFLGTYFFRLIREEGFLKRFATTTLILSVGSAGIVYLAASRWESNWEALKKRSLATAESQRLAMMPPPPLPSPPVSVPTPTPKPSTHPDVAAAPTTTPPPPPAPPEPAPKIETPPVEPAAEETHPPAPPSLPHRQFSSESDNEPMISMAPQYVIQPGLDPLRRIFAKLTSLFHVFSPNNSPNVRTRWLMWKDALSELFSVGLYAPDLKASDLKRYNLPERWQQDSKSFFMVQVKGRGLEGYPVLLKLDANEGNPPPARNQFRRMAQIIFGIPFGKLFLPPEVVYAVKSAWRYDPHNSLIHILYRMGLLGLGAFMGILIFTTRTWKRLNTPVAPTSELSSHLYAIGGCLFYFLVHSLTDNTLENAFKGLWFWLFLGILLALERRRTDDPSTLHRS